jgi:hypothetical protein
LIFSIDAFADVIAFSMTPTAPPHRLAAFISLLFFHGRRLAFAFGDCFSRQPLLQPPPVSRSASILLRQLRPKHFFFSFHVFFLGFAKASDIAASRSEDAIAAAFSIRHSFAAFDGRFSLSPDFLQFFTSFLPISPLLLPIFQLH